MTPPVVASHSLRFKFVFRFDQTNRKEKNKCKAGGKPSTWLPPGGLVERLQTNKSKQTKPQIIAANDQNNNAKQTENQTLKKRSKEPCRLNSKTYSNQQTNSIDQQIDSK